MCSKGCRITRDTAALPAPCSENRLSIYVYFVGKARKVRAQSNRPDILN